MQINLTDKKGFILHTANSRIKEDITVGVNTEDLNISPTTSVQSFDGLYGKVIVGAIPIETKKISELDFSELESINIIPSQGKYLSLITIDKDSNLLPGNIRKDTKIYGVTGTLISSDSSDATANAGDIVEGKTAYVNNKKITGTVAERSDSFLISGTYFTKVQVSEEAQILALVSGSLTQSYLLRSGTKIETNATYQQVAKAIGLTAEKIAVGNTILGIEGTSSGIDTSDADAEAANILEGKTAYVNSKKIIGTMSNNGELNYTPTSEEQIIPAGYTTGGKVNPFDFMTSEDYSICYDLSREILGYNIPVKEGLLLDLEAKSSTVDDSSGIIWRDLLKSKNITVKNGSMDVDYSIMFNGTSTEFDSGIAQNELINGYTVVTRLRPDIWNNYRGVAGLHGNYGKGMVLWQYVDGSIACGNIDATITQIGTSVTPEQLPVNEWTIVTTTYNKESGMGITYIGSEEVNRSAAYGTLTPDGNLIVGKGLASAERYYDGKMSHFIVYNRELSQEEISQVVNYISETV